MPLNRALVDADDSVDVLYGVLSALMMALPEAVRETHPADLLQTNGYCHIAALHTLRLVDLEEMGVLRGHARTWGANTFWHVMALKRALQ